MFDVKEHVCLIALKYSLEDFLIPPRFLINSNLAPFLKLVDSHPHPPKKFKYFNFYIRKCHCGIIIVCTKCTLYTVHNNKHLII